MINPLYFHTSVGSRRFEYHCILVLYSLVALTSWAEPIAPAPSLDQTSADVLQLVATGLNTREIANFSRLNRQIHRELLRDQNLRYRLIAHGIQMRLGERLIWIPQSRLKNLLARSLTVELTCFNAGVSLGAVLEHLPLPNWITTSALQAPLNNLYLNSLQALTNCHLQRALSNSTRREWKLSSKRWQALRIYLLMTVLHHEAALTFQDFQQLDPLNLGTPSDAGVRPLTEQDSHIEHLDAVHQEILININYAEKFTNSNALALIAGFCAINFLSFFPIRFLSHEDHPVIISFINSAHLLYLGWWIEGMLTMCWNRVANRRPNRAWIFAENMLDTALSRRYRGSAQISELGSLRIPDWMSSPIHQLQALSPERGDRFENAQMRRAFDRICEMNALIHLNDNLPADLDTALDGAFHSRYPKLGRYLFWLKTILGPSPLFSRYLLLKQLKIWDSPESWKAFKINRYGPSLRDPNLAPQLMPWFDAIDYLMSNAQPNQSLDSTKDELTRRLMTEDASILAIQSTLT